MAIVRIQLARQFAGPPAIGQYRTYTGAWFSTATPVPSPAVLALLGKLWTSGLFAVGNQQVFADKPMVSGVNAGVVSAWEWQGSTMTSIGKYPIDLAGGVVVSPTTFPSQCMITVGYRANAGGDRRRGRSRWFLGPFTMGANFVSTTSGGARLTSAGVDKVASASRGFVADLAAAGWTLQVKSGQKAASVFNPAVELYVDDVFDVQRSRRTWQNYQARENL